MHDRLHRSSLGVLIGVGDDPCSRQGLGAEILGKKLITSEDLDVIRKGYYIPASIILSAPAPHETSQDHRPGHLCLNEYMLGARVRIPFNFGVAKELLGRSAPMEGAADLSDVPRLRSFLDAGGREGH
ncbi:hypothetical protein ACLOJK_019742 [Asimina triloba]